MTKGWGGKIAPEQGAPLSRQTGSEFRNLFDILKFQDLLKLHEGRK
jgi:hypothetical protein